MRFNLKFLTTVFSLTLLVSGFFVFNNKVEAGTSATASANISVGLPSDGFKINKVSEFTISTEVTSGEGIMVIGNSNFSNTTVINSLEYFETKDGKWYPFPIGDYGPSTGFPLSNATSKFRISFNKEGNYNFTINIREAINHDNIVGTTNATFIVPDTTSPFITEQAVQAGNKIIYKFNEPVHLIKQSDGIPTELNKTLLGIYSIDTEGNYGPNKVLGVDITDAVFDSITNTLTVTYSGNLEKTTNSTYIIDAWGYSIVDLSDNVIGKDPKGVFTVEAVAPKIVSSNNDLKTKTITYTFDEPIQLVEQANPSNILQDPAGLVKIYTAESYATRNIGDPEPKITFGGTNIATYNQITNELKIVYTKDIPAGKYLADTWGYTVTDLAGNKLDESSNGKALFDGDSIKPTAIVSNTSNSKGGEIIYTFSEPIQLMNSDKTEIIDAADYVNSLGIYELNDYSTHVYGQSDVIKVGEIKSAILSENDTKITIEYTGNLEGKTDMQYVVDAWGKNITDKAGNKMESNPSQIFTVKAKAPTMISSVTGKTITYTFSEPVQLVKQDDNPAMRVATPFNSSMLGIYEVDVSGNYGPSTKADVAISGTFNSNVLEATYTGNLEKTYNTNYVIDAWGYDITDLAGNIISKSELAHALFTVNAEAPTMVSVNHSQSTKTITYTFSEPMKLVDQATLTDTEITPDLIGIYSVDTNGNYGPKANKAATTSTSTLNADKTVLTVTYTGILPAGKGVVDAWGYNITDLAGNKIVKSPNQMFTILPTMTGSVSIDGLAKYGNTLTANTSLLVNAGTPTYQWSRNTSPNAGDDIYGATSSTYILTNNDIGRTISLTVKAEKDVSIGSVISPSTEIVANKDAPIITITPYNDQNKTNQSITVHATTNEGTLNMDSCSLDFYGDICEFIATDINFGNVTKLSVTANNIDKVAPVVTITGANPQVIEVGSPYVELGATMYDYLDPNTPVIIDASKVNTSILGSYEVTYSATDTYGNNDTKTRTVSIVDTTKPVITINGTNPISVYVGSTYTDAGAVATDNYDGGKVNVVPSGSVDTSVIGVYTITYTATDSSDNTETATRTVKVVQIPSSGGSSSHTTPAQHIEDCKPGEKFNSSTGKSCTIKANPETPGKVLGAEKFNFTKLLKKGLTGDEVMELQKYLISLGYDLGTADGKFGPKTKSAVIKFQLANNLKGDGIIGALTRAILNK